MAKDIYWSYASRTCPFLSVSVGLQYMVIFELVLSIGVNVIFFVDGSKYSIVQVIFSAPVLSQCMPAVTAANCIVRSDLVSASQNSKNRPVQCQMRTCQAVYDTQRVGS